MACGCDIGAFESSDIVSFILIASAGGALLADECERSLSIALDAQNSLNSSFTGESGPM